MKIFFIQKNKKKDEHLKNSSQEENLRDKFLFLLEIIRLSFLSEDKALKIKVLLFKIFSLEIFLFSIGIFFNYWHYSFSYKVFLNKDLSGIKIYFLIYALFAFLEILIKIQNKFYQNLFIFKGRINLYNFYSSQIRKAVFNFDGVTVPCQRLSEDLKKILEMIIKLIIPAFFSIIKIPVYFIIILKILNIKIACVVFLYSIVSTFLITKLNNKMFLLDLKIEDEEGYLRKNLVNFFNDKSQKEIPCIEGINKVYTEVAYQEKVVGFVQLVLLKISSFLKYLLALPLYLKGFIAFPVLGQAVNAIGNFFESSNFLIEKRFEIIQLNSLIFRLKELTNKNKNH